MTASLFGLSPEMAMSLFGIIIPRVIQNPLRYNENAFSRMFVFLGGSGWWISLPQCCGIGLHTSL